MASCGRMPIAMCGRYSLATGMHGLDERFTFRGEGLSLHLRFNIAPTQQVLTVVNDGQENRGELMRWGLVPFWAKDIKVGARMINARAETVAESRAFKRPLQRQRCLVLADGFYEWRKEDKVRIPMHITLKGREPFAFAGLWDFWTNKETGERVRSCTIITCPPNVLMEPIHNRMPVILPQEAEHLWLDPKIEQVDVLTSMLIPFPAGSMETYPISNLVNSVKNDVPECIDPL